MTFFGGDCTCPGTILWFASGEWCETLNREQHPGAKRLVEPYLCEYCLKKFAFQYLLAKFYCGALAVPSSAFACTARNILVSRYVYGIKNILKDINIKAKHYSPRYGCCAIHFKRCLTNANSVAPSASLSWFRISSVIGKRNEWIAHAIVLAQ